MFIDPSEAPASTLLLVCTANVCRSPLAQAIVAEAWGRIVGLSGVRVESAGIRATPEQAICSLVADDLSAHGLLSVARAHQARAVSRELVHDASLVITFERSQRSRIAELVPGQQSKVFTLREAVGLFEVLEKGGVPASRLAKVDSLDAVAQLLHSLRGRATSPVTADRARWWTRRATPPADPLTIADGHNLGARAHAQTIGEVRAYATRFAVSVRDLPGPR